MKCWWNVCGRSFIQNYLIHSRTYTVTYCVSSIARECEVSYSCCVVSPGLRRSVKTAQESEKMLFNVWNCKNCFQTVDKLLHKRAELSYPPSSDVDWAKRFADFFNSKISVITSLVMLAMRHLSSQTQSTALSSWPALNRCRLNKWNILSRLVL